MNSSNGREAAVSPRRRKRIITEARKEQNRISQKLYRQRQRERAQGWESHSRPLQRKHHQLRPRQFRGPLPGASEKTTINTATTVEPQMQSNPDALFGENALQPHFPRPLEPACTVHEPIPGDEPNTNENLFLSTSPISLFLGMDAGMLINTLGYDSTSNESIAFGADDARSGNGLSGSNALEYPVMNRASTMSNSSNWSAPIDATRQSCSPSRHLLGEKLGSIPLFPSNSMQSNCYQQRYTACISQDPGDLRTSSMEVPLSQIPELQYFVSATSNFLYGHRVPSSEPSLPSSYPLPDPYINTILGSLTVTLLPYFHNALCIGLEFQDLLTHRSPFYNPKATAADDPQSLLTSARKPWIPTHLQPTLPQILIPHHPYLDLLPFPALRARAITFAATTPQLFDSMEFKRDVFSDGLYCSRHGNHGGNNQPWDLRSWQAAPWFLRKWRLLMG